MSNPLIRAISRTAQQIYRSGTTICNTGRRMAGETLESAQRTAQSAARSIRSIDRQDLPQAAVLGIVTLTPASRPLGVYALGRRLYHQHSKNLPHLLRENYGRPLSVDLTPGGRRVSKQWPIIIQSMFDYLNIYISPFGTERYFPTMAQSAGAETRGAVAGARAGAAAAAATGAIATVHHFRAVPMAEVIGEEAARDIMVEVADHNQVAGHTANASRNVDPNEPVEHLDTRHVENN